MSYSRILTRSELLTIATRGLRLIFLFVLPGVFGGTCFAAEYIHRFAPEDKTQITSVAADGAGNIFVCGYTGNRAAIPGARILGPVNADGVTADSFVMKFGADGKAAGASVIGGGQFDYAARVAVDPFGNVIVYGYTQSPDFPTKNALQPGLAGRTDVFVCKFDESCTNLLFSTLWGGSEDESATAMAVDGAGDIVIAGSTVSEGFPSGENSPRSSFYSQPFVAKLAGDGSHLRYAFRFGGSGYEQITAIAADMEGNAFLTGWTSSFDFPALNVLPEFRPVYGDGSAFVAQLAADGSLVFSTLLNGNCDDRPEGIAVNGLGEIFVAGWTCSDVFPASPTAFLSPASRNSYKTFLVKLAPQAAGILTTNLNSFTAYDRYSVVAVSPNGSAFAAGTLGGGFGIPVVAELRTDGSTSAFFDRLNCGDERAGVRAMAVDGAGAVILCGEEFDPDTRRWGSFVSRHQPAAVAPLREPKVTMLSPTGGGRIGPKTPLYLSAAVVGATGPVASVKFYAGKRLIGTSTNVPFTAVWTNSGRGVYHLKAVAKVDGKTLKSCVVRVIVRSPRNDNFARRIRLRGETVNVSVDLEGATREADEGLSLYPSESVWFSWTAPRDGLFSIDVSTDNSAPGCLQVFAGTQISNLSALTDFYQRREKVLSVRRGVTYQIRVAGGLSASPFRLRIRPVTAPVNDHFANATPLVGNSVSVTATTLHATTEPGEYPASSGYAGDATVWFSWTAPAEGHYLVSIDGQGSLPDIGVHTGSSISNLTSVGQYIWGSTDGVALTAQAGTKYFIRLHNGDSNDCVLNITSRAPPPNDNFADRFTIPAGSNSVVGTLIGATSEPDEPRAYYLTDPSVWWSWRPETAGVYWVNVVPLGRAGGRSGGSVWPVDSEVVRAFAGDTLTTLTRVPGSLGSSPLILHASPETNYHLVVVGSMASFALEIRPVSSPPNDSFDSATSLQGSVVVKSGTTVGATLEPGEPSHRRWDSQYQGNDSVWFRWTAPSNGIYSIIALNASALNVYQGDSLPGLTLVASNASSHVLRLDGGVEYRLAIAGANGFRLVIRPGVLPENDDFSNARWITGLSTEFGGPIAGATFESGEPEHDRWGKGSIWFSWTAPTNGSYRIRFTGHTSGSVTVYTGDSLGELVRVGWDRGFDGYEFQASGGASYRIAVQAYSSSGDLYSEIYGPQDVTLELRYYPPPLNDDFAMRVPLTGAPVSLIASNVGATLQPGEPRIGRDARGHSVWWTWRPPRDGRATFTVERVEGADYFYGAIGIFAGSSVDALTALSSANPGASAFNLPVKAGYGYHISVDNDWSLSGQFRLAVRYTSPPSNDAFADRLPFTEQAMGTLEGASRETAEPGYQLDPSGSSVWWTWTAPADGLYELSLEGASYLTVIEVFTGDALAALVPVDGEPWYKTSYKRFRATAGTVYAIRITGPGTEGQYTLQASFIPPPSNDHFADRILLVGTNIIVGSTNLAATAESNEPAHGGRPASRSVWWTWVAPINGMARISMPIYFSGSVAAYTGDHLNELVSVREGHGGIAFLVEAGTTYQIAVDAVGYGDVFTWSLTLHQSPVNDAFVNRLMLVGEVATTTGTALGAGLEAGEPRLTFSPGHSVWWKWIAPETGRYTFAVSGAPADTALALYTGSELTNLVLVASNAPGVYAINLPIAAETEVAISIDADIEVAGYSGSFGLRIARTQVPANDDFANRTVLNTGTVGGNLEGSSCEPGEPGFQNDPGGTSIWWRYRPADTGWYSISVTTESGTTYGLPPFPYYPRASVLVFSGSNLTNLSAVPSRGYPPALFRLEGGTEYSVQVSGRHGWFGPLVLGIESLITPSNDQFANAQAIPSDNAIVAGSNEAASMEAGEPAPRFGGDNSIWWKWTAVSNGVFAITRSNSTAYALIDVYTGNSVSNLTSVPDTAYGRESGEYLFRASAGTTYYIQVVTSWYGGAVQLAFARVNPPPNDDFANRAVLNGSHVSILASNFNATAEPADPLSGWYAEQTVWWKWTAPASGLVTADAQAADASFVMGVFQGSSFEELDFVEVSETPLEFHAFKGEEYVIGITTSLSQATEFTLSLDLSAPLSANDGLVSIPLPTVTEPTGKPLMVETSTNLVDWMPFSTLAPGEREFRVVPNQSEPQRFFRVR